MKRAASSRSRKSPSIFPLRFKLSRLNVGRSANLFIACGLCGQVVLSEPNPMRDQGSAPQSVPNPGLRAVRNVRISLQHADMRRPFARLAHVCFVRRPCWRRFLLFLRVGAFLFFSIYLLPLLRGCVESRPTTISPVPRHSPLPPLPPGLLLTLL